MNGSVRDDLKRGVFALVNGVTGQLWDLNWDQKYLNTTVRQENNLDDDWKVVRLVLAPLKDSP